MAQNKFYKPGEERAGRVNDLFATIAPRYDLINDLQSFWLHRWWKRRLIRLADPRPGERALDLCCGTGDVAFALAAKGAEVTGLDFSAAMLSVAARRAEAGGKAGNPGFLQGDALATGLPEGRYDIVTISYGLRNLSDFAGGIREMTRVARPGARVLVLDFGKPPWAPWRKAYFLYLKHVVPRFGRLFFGDSDTHGYIHESLLHYPAQEGVATMMREARFTDVRIIHLLGGIMSINYGRTPRSAQAQPKITG